MISMLKLGVQLCQHFLGSEEQTWRESLMVTYKMQAGCLLLGFRLQLQSEADFQTQNTK